MRRIILSTGKLLPMSLIFALVILVCSTSAIPEEYPEGWWKGNTHTHSCKYVGGGSDGQGSPNDVAKHYKDKGYDFLVLTDHNHCCKLTDEEGGNELLKKFADCDTCQDPDFLRIKGEEISKGPADGSYHANGIGITNWIPMLNNEGKHDTLEESVVKIVYQGGLAQLNHPDWPSTPYYPPPQGEPPWPPPNPDDPADDKLEELRGIENLKLMEIYNAYGGISQDEKIWDWLLSNGKLIYGVASDDCHYIGIAWYLDPCNGPFDLEPYRLFSMDPKFQEDLESGVFSDRLREEFRKQNNIPELPQNVTIRYEEQYYGRSVIKWWLVNDEDGNILYFINSTLDFWPGFDKDATAILNHRNDGRL